MHRLNDTLLLCFLQCNGHGFYSYQIMGRPDQALLQEHTFMIIYVMSRHQDIATLGFQH
jgi:hypothetical protein